MNTLFFFVFFLLHFFYICVCVCVCGGGWHIKLDAKSSGLRGDGKFSFLFWSSVFDLLLGATVNTVAMAMAGEEAKTYHVI